MATRRKYLKYKTRRGKKVLRRNQRSKKNRRMTKRYRGGNGEIDDKYENVLLIIDPQNDFSDAKEGYRTEGNLAVPGSSGDYERIIDFINTNKDKLAEIHVSLDTHTPRHIGNPGFWTRVDENGNTEESEDCDDTDGLRILSIHNDNDDATKVIYQGYSVVAGIRHLSGGDELRYYIPKNYGGDYSKLCAYVKKYIKFYSTPESKHGQVPWIWREHCFEDSTGHKVASELQDGLNNENIKSKVRYHIKGQNNLAEMYSIFSAEMPVTVNSELNDYMNTSKRTETYDIAEGVNSYEDTKNKINLETERNTKMMDKLLGLDTGKLRRVYVCGEAKTHCVKSSLIDLMEYAKEKGIEKERIVLLSDMTSPIPGSPLNNIVQTTRDMGYSVLPENAVDK